MGGENTPLTLNDARHLLRRTEFGATPRALDTLRKRASTRGEAADYLLDFRPSRFRPRASSIDLAHNKWVKYMIRSKLQLQEKLVLFWHDHFATNFATVGQVTLMANQNRLLRTYCKGNFKDFVKAINVDAAMMDFLDTNDNRKQQPNENYGRELQELFTLGVNDFAGNPNYEQEDVVQIARAFTGWRYDDKGVAYFSDNRHDYMIDWPERGAKRIYKTRGGFNDANGQDFAADGEGDGGDRAGHRHHLRAPRHGREEDGGALHRPPPRHLLRPPRSRHRVRRRGGGRLRFRHPVGDRPAPARHLRARLLLRDGGAGALRRDDEEVGEVAGRLRGRHAAAAQHEAEEQVPVRRRRQLRGHPLDSSTTWASCSSIRPASSAGTGRRPGSAARRCWRATVSRAT